MNHIDLHLERNTVSCVRYRSWRERINNDSQGIAGDPATDAIQTTPMGPRSLAGSVAVAELGASFNPAGAKSNHKRLAKPHGGFSPRHGPNREILKGPLQPRGASIFAWNIFFFSGSVSEAMGKTFGGTWDGLVTRAVALPAIFRAQAYNSHQGSTKTGNLELVDRKFLVLRVSAPLLRSCQRDASGSGGITSFLAWSEKDGFIANPLGLVGLTQGREA